MSEFDECGESQDFEEPAIDNVEVPEEDEVQVDAGTDSAEAMSEGDSVEFQDDNALNTAELQDFNDNESYEETEETIDDSNYEQSAEGFNESEELQDESELSPAELREMAEMEAAEARQAAEEWADSNGLDTWSDGTPRQSCEVTDNSTTDTEELQDESELTPSELRERAEMEAAEAQQAAEEWADNGGANRWSDGTLRQGHEDDTYDRTTNEVEQMEEEGLREQQEAQETQEAQEAAELDASIEAKDREVSDLDSQYDQARKNADMAESDEDKDYWNSQSNEIQSARDNASYDAAQLRSQRR